MKSRTAWTSIPGSERTIPAGAIHKGDVPNDEVIEISVKLKAVNQFSLSDADLARMAQSPGALMTQDDFIKNHGVNPGSVKVAKDYIDHLKTQGFASISATEPDPLSGFMKIKGTVGELEKAFGVSLKLVEKDGQIFRARDGEIKLPAWVAGHVDAVLGFSTVPSARERFSPRGPAPMSGTSGLGFTPLQVWNAYGADPSMTGAGVKIGILELGGGLDGNDVAAYCHSLGMPNPQITTVSVDGASPRQGRQSERRFRGLSRYLHHGCDLQSGADQCLFRSQHRCRFRRCAECRGQGWLSGRVL